MPIDTAPVAYPKDLEGARFVDLQAQFETSEKPQVAELDGLYRGRIVAIAGTDALPGPARSLVSALLNSILIPWVGKRFGTNESGGWQGTNTWFTTLGPNFLGFVCRSGNDALVLDYDIATNPKPLRAMLGELRRLAPALYLGRLSVRVGERATPILYFTLDNI